MIQNNWLNLYNHSYAFKFKYAYSLNHTPNIQPSYLSLNHHSSLQYIKYVYLYDNKESANLDEYMIVMSNIDKTTRSDDDEKHALKVEEENDLDDSALN